MMMDSSVEMVVPADRIDSVSWLSITSISLEKRFIIRPSGVVSKNETGACRMRCTAR